VKGPIPEAIHSITKKANPKKNRLTPAKGYGTSSKAYSHRAQEEQPQIQPVIHLRRVNGYCYIEKHHLKTQYNTDDT
jgi:hypothetical protein